MIFLVFSCSSKRNIIYLQDINDTTIDNYDYKDIVIKPDDILNINISSSIPETTAEFNRESDSSGSSLELLQVNGYLVNNSGNITFPVIGEINLLGLTIKEAQKKIYKLLEEKQLLIEHSVEIKILNSHITILGEVKNPGRYNYLENNMNILKVIGMAGDLTINGNRKDVKVIRQYNNKSIVKSIDLTTSAYLQSEVFHVLSGDIIIVNPNYSRIKSAGIIGNSGTLISLLSFLLSSIIIINN